MDFLTSEKLLGQLSGYSGNVDIWNKFWIFDHLRSNISNFILKCGTDEDE